MTLTIHPLIGGGLGPRGAKVDDMNMFPKEEMGYVGSPGLC